jgi:phosphatidylserine decarboxylase
MKVHGEGLNIILITAGIIAAINYALINFCSAAVAFVFFGISILLFLIIVNFFRCPKRIYKDPAAGDVVSPADGTVVVVEETVEEEYFHDKRIQVSVFMSLLNAHVNWVPCNGKIVHYAYRKGRFQAAYLPKSSTENERSSIVIETPEGEQVLVRQIAGAMAKRIVTYVEKGEECKINEQLGFIKFGSRVDIFLPLDAKINVDVGECVRGNKTLIAQLRNEVYP